MTQASLILKYEGEQPASINDIPAIAARMIDEEKIIDGKHYRLGCIIADARKAPDFIQELHYIEWVPESAEEQAKRVDAGMAVFSAMIDAVPEEACHGVIMNAIGMLAVGTFGTAEYESHEDRLAEFDSWCRYTRQQIDESIKQRMN